MQQLQSENARLREETSPRVVTAPANDLFEGPSSVPIPVINSLPTPVSIPSLPVVTERYVYVPRERKCPRFSGKASQDSLGEEDWIEEVRSSLTLCHMSDTEQDFFVFDLLEGEAKAEMKFRTPAERNTPENIFSILRETYGCSKSYIGQRTQFFQRKQMEGESLREYSHPLMSLIEAVKRRDPQCFANPDSVLRDQFIEHVRDNMLR